jgi:hypothetical protein
MGGGGSKCSKRDRIDPKPSVDMNVGVTIAGSEECRSCSLSFPKGNTASAVSVTRGADDGDLKNMIILKPYTPFAMEFNGSQAVFTSLQLYYPAPLRVEGIQADAMVQCVSGNVMLFIPLMRGSGSGTSMNFLGDIAKRLAPNTPEGLGIIDSKTNKYSTQDISVGQSWSLTQLVTGSEPYFTWVNSKIEQYTISDWECERHIGWKSSPGPQVIYLQNPIQVNPGDIDSLVATIKPVHPEDVLAAVTHPLYASGNPNCGPPPIKLRPPIPKTTEQMVGYVLFIGVLFFAFMGIVVAVAIANQENNVFKFIGDGIAEMFKFPEPKKVAAPAIAEGANDLLGNLSNLVDKNMEQLKNPEVENGISGLLKGMK